MAQRGSLEMRISEEERERCARAAKSVGRPITTFIREAALAEAERLLRSERLARATDAEIAQIRDRIGEPLNA